jgi:excisionase family DNA binding protein
MEDLPPPSTATGPELPYTVREYAALARLSPNAVYELVKRNELPAVHFGRSIRIPRRAGNQRLIGAA